MGTQGGQEFQKPTSQWSANKSQDLSSLRLPIETTVTGLKQAFSVLLNGRHDVIDLLVNEANIIYECKSCLNFFRCISLFISHKRSFCLKRTDLFTNFSPKENGTNTPPVVVAQITGQNVVRMVHEPEDIGLKLPEFDLYDYSPSLQLLKNHDFLRQTGVKKPLESIVRGMSPDGEASLDKNHSQSCLSNSELVNFADFYGKRFNPKTKTVVLDPSGKILKPGAVSKEFMQAMRSYRAEMNRANASSFSYIFLCPKCERHFPSVKLTRQHLSTAHFVSDPRLNDFNQPIINSRKPLTKNAICREELTKRKYSINLKRDPAIERAVKLRNLVTQSGEKEKKLAVNIQLVDLQLRRAIPMREGYLAPRLRTFCNPLFSKEIQMNGCNESPESDPLLPVKVVLEKLTVDNLVNLHVDPMALKGCNTIRSPTKPASISTKLSSSIQTHEKSNSNTGYGENSEPQKSRRKQARPRSVLNPKKNLGQNIPDSLSHSRKRSKPSRVLPFIDPKRLRVALA